MYIDYMLWNFSADIYQTCVYMYTFFSVASDNLVLVKLVFIGWRMASVTMEIVANLYTHQNGKKTFQVIMVRYNINIMRMKAS